MKTINLSAYQVNGDYSNINSNILKIYGHKYAENESGKGNNKEG